MTNYIYIWEEPTFSIYTFCSMIKNNKINKNDLIPMCEFINTQNACLLWEGGIYDMITNCVCSIDDNPTNIICCVEREG